jgi:hypothetical protein
MTSPKTNPRTDEQPLSTADMVSATKQAQSPTPSPKYVQGEERDHPERTTEQPTPLLAGDESGKFRSRWDDIQTGFVDEPRRSVEQADQLVAELMKRLAEVFAQERGRLEEQWSRGDQVNTEDLRIALQRYRSFFQRLLAA